MCQVSILMPVWNGAKFVNRCLESILNQDFTDYELIIVDDGSTDNTVELINNFNDDRINLFQCEHKGIVDALNFGLKQCTGKYICRMDIDDMMMKDGIGQRYRYMESHPNVDFITTGSTRPEIEHLMRNVGADDEFDMTIDNIKHNKCGVHPTAFFKRETFNTEYSREFEYREDLELYLRLASRKNYVMKYLPYKMTVYDMRHPDATSYVQKERLRKLKYKLVEIYGK